jgi:DNA polymerase-3 subunit beta
MIINVARRDFYAALSSLQNVTGKKGTIAILNNILVETKTETIVLTATDLEVGIKIEIPAEILSPGSITLPARKIFEIVRETDIDHIHVEVNENNWVTIKTDNGNYKIAGTDSEEYPSFPDFEKSMMAAVSADSIADLIEKTIFSVAQEGESQFNLTGALLEKEVRDEKNFLRVISSDGHRLTLMEREIETDVQKINLDKTTLIPRKGMQEIKKMCENEDFIEIGFDDKQAIAKTDNKILVIRLLNGDFPDYKNIIKAISKENCIEIDRISLVSALKRINLFTEDIFNTVQFNFSEEKLTLSSQNMDIGSGQEEIAIQFKGEDIKLGFNGKYFVEALQVMNSEKIKAYLSSEKSPCLIEADDDPGFMGIIMPMAI